MDGCAGSTGDAGRSLSSGGTAKVKAAQFDDVGPHQQWFLIFIGDMLDGDEEPIARGSKSRACRDSSWNSNPGIPGACQTAGLAE